MNENLMWVWLMHLSTNMWGDQGESTMNAPFQDHLTTDDDVWKKIIDVLPEFGFNTVLIDVGDAIEYESHPEISIPGAWSKDKLKKELDRMRAMGLTPYPKLNFSACHDAWMKDYSFMLSTPEYYRVVEDVIREVAEVFDYPALFHLGMDEETMSNQGEDKMRIVRPDRLWYHDVNFMFDVCEKVGSRPWIWADKCWGDPAAYLKNMSKSVLQSNWWYTTLRRNPDGSFKRVETETYHILEKAGYDQVPTFSAIGGRWYNAKETMEMGRDDIAPERLKGYMSASWWFAYPRYYYGMLHEANLFKVGRDIAYPELAGK